MYTFMVILLPAIVFVVIVFASILVEKYIRLNP